VDKRELFIIVACPDGSTWICSRTIWKRLSFLALGGKSGRKFTLR